MTPMSDLQDAAGRLANRIPLEQGDRELLVEAARLVASLDREQLAYLIGSYVNDEGEPEYGIADGVIAALTPGDIKQ